VPIRLEQPRFRTDNGFFSGTLLVRVVHNQDYHVVP
jgi:hypothetical protein